MSASPRQRSGTFSGDPSFKAALNRKGFFSVSGNSVDPQFGDTLNLTIQGRVKKNGTTSGRILADEVFQVGGTITELTSASSSAFQRRARLAQSPPFT